MGSFGGQDAVWIIVLFDLPTDTQQSRRQYTRFRKSLLNDSFTMMQYSVYMRHCASDENAAVHVSKVKASLPPDGEVRIVKITDKQFGKIQVYYGKKRRPTENAPAQLEFL
jgi:CRISPR-associated protein Cas2